MIEETANTPDLENRARRAREAYEFLVGWSPDFVAQLRPEDAVPVKIAVLCSSNDRRNREVRNGRYSPNRKHQRQLEVVGSYIQNIRPEVKDAGHQIRESVFANIYDLLLFATYTLWARPGPSTFYRGQRCSEWRLVPSSCRSHLETIDLSKMSDEFMMKIRSGDSAPGTFLAHLETHWNEQRDQKQKDLRDKFPKIAAKLQQLTSASTRVFQEEAVIQHYLSGTPLLDVTQSFHVAAFFATRERKDLKRMGAIYFILPADVDGVAKIVNFADLPHDFARIHMQKASFLLLKYPAMVDWPGHFIRWCFHHTEAGAEFESKDMGITKSDLLPDDCT